MIDRFDLPPDERILQLMADRATEGLSRRDALELDEYFERNPDVHRDALDYAAAAVFLALDAEHGEPLPAGVKERASREAARYYPRDRW